MGKDEEGLREEARLLRVPVNLGVLLAGDDDGAQGRLRDEQRHDDVQRVAPSRQAPHSEREQALRHLSEMS